MLAVFSRALDANLLFDSNVILRASGGDGTFNDGNENSVAVRVQSTGAGGAALWIRATSALPPERYELRIRGSGPVAVADLAGNPIDGDGDGIPGGDAVVRFQVAGDAP
jgi:hypothetical protein